MGERAVIAHTYDQMVAALEAAAALRIPIILQSAPEAIYYAGGLYTLEAFRQAKKRFPRVEAHLVLDCSDAWAAAVEALQSGHTHIRSRASAEIRVKLTEIAQQYGAQLVDMPYEVLDLRNARDPKAACINWLQTIEQLEPTG